MPKTYRTPRRRSWKSRLRAQLDAMRANTLYENWAVNFPSIEQAVRGRLQRNSADLSDAEIEFIVNKIIKHGSKPTDAKVLTPGRIPKDVIEARRAERKRTVKKMRQYRRGRP